MVLKSELIEMLAMRFPQLEAEDAHAVVNIILDAMAEQLAHGERIEIRGLGSFSVYYRAPHRGINPKTGTSVLIPGKFLPRFRPGKELRERVDMKKDDQGATSEPSSFASLLTVEG